MDRAAVFLALIWLCVACTHQCDSPSGAPASEAMEAGDAVVPDARVQGETQAKFVELLVAKPDYVEAWGLVTYSGWADQGQFFVLAKAQRRDPLLVHIPPGGKEMKPEVAIGAEMWAAFQNELEDFAKLDDLDAKALDGTQYEYFCVQKSGPPGQQKAKVTKRVFMNNPFLMEEAKGHHEIVNRFLDLNK